LTHRRCCLQPEIATERARELSRQDLGGAAFGLYTEGFDYYFKSDTAEVCETIAVLWLLLAQDYFMQNFMLWLNLFDNIITSWKKLNSVSRLALRLRILFHSFLDRSLCESK
jgi:hypothetical protein